MARQVVLKPKAQHHVLVAAKSSSLLTIKPRILQSKGQFMLAARAVMDVSLAWQFYNLVNYFFNNKVHLPNTIKIAHTENPLSVMHAVDTVGQNTAPIGTPEADLNSINSEVSVSSEVKQQRSGHHDVSTVHFSI